MTSQVSDIREFLVEGTPIRYVEAGEGPPVVFVHGGGGDHRIWNGQRNAVAQGHRFIALDQRYFGTAPWPDDGVHFSLDTHAADLAGFIRELAAGPAHLVGHSYGAIVALTVVLEHPQLVRGLLLNEPPLTSVLTDAADAQILRDWLQEAEAMSASARVSEPAAIAKSFYDWVNAEPGSFDALPADTRAVRLQNGRTIALQLSPATRASITCAQLGRIAVPATITHGSLTRPYFQRVCERVQGCIAGSASVAIPGARHGAPGQAPAAFNQALLAFLEAYG